MTASVTYHCCSRDKKKQYQYNIKPVQLICTTGTVTVVLTTGTYIKTGINLHKIVLSKFRPCLIMTATFQGPYYSLKVNRNYCMALIGILRTTNLINGSRLKLYYKVKYISHQRFHTNSI